MAKDYHRRRAWISCSHFAKVGLGGVLAFVLLLLSSCSLPGTISSQQSSVSTRSETLITTPVTSSGCGKPIPFAPGLSANETIRLGVYERMYRIHLPSDYQNRTQQALVLNFHGHGSTAAVQEKLTGLSQLADQQDFLAVYPQGSIGPDHRTGWATGPSWDPHVNDVLFISDLLNRVQSEFCIDPLRVYAMGFSNGGGMANLLATRMAGRIAAFASVSGSYYPVAGGYHPGRSVSLLEIHGTVDHVVPYNGSRQKDYSSVPKWLVGWAQYDHCNSRPAIFLKQSTMIGEQWVGCQAGATIIHYRIQHEGHIWPHVLFREQTQKGMPWVNATTLIWHFFQSHSMRRKLEGMRIPHARTSYDGSPVQRSTFFLEVGS